MVDDGFPGDSESVEELVPYFFVGLEVEFGDFFVIVLLNEIFVWPFEWCTCILGLMAQFPLSGTLRASADCSAPWFGTCRSFQWI